MTSDLSGGGWHPISVRRAMVTMGYRLQSCGAPAASLMLNDFFHVVVSTDAAMTVADNYIAVDDKLRWPKVAKVVAKNLLFVIDDNRKFDAHSCYRIPEFPYVSFIFGPRRMDADHNQTLRPLLFMKLHDVRHRLNTWLAVESQRSMTQACPARISM